MKKLTKQEPTRYKMSRFEDEELKPTEPQTNTAQYLYRVMDIQSKDTVRDEITDISLEFVEMVFDMAQGKNKKKKKTFWVDKTSEKVKELLDKEIKKAYKAGMENTGSGEL